MAARAGRGSSLWDAGTKARASSRQASPEPRGRRTRSYNPIGTLPRRGGDHASSAHRGRGRTDRGDPHPGPSLPPSSGPHPRRSLRAKHAPPAPTAACFPLAGRSAGAPAPPPYWLRPPRFPAPSARQPRLTSRGLRRRRPRAQPRSPLRQRRRRGALRRMVRAVRAAPRSLSRSSASAELAAAGSRPPHRACGRPAR